MYIACTGYPIATHPPHKRLNVVKHALAHMFRVIQGGSDGSGAF